jgi:2-polyprenyl-3-methyl-5-hydroxy-6-metoxy-1,4-benzoquinol methylase
MNPLDCLELYADADFYDQEFAKRTHEIPFYLKQARLACGPILEVCCGTGRLTLPIARAGGDITGLDVAPAMLERARRKATSEKLSVSWIEGDCRQIASDRKYALIFSATNAMQHLHDSAVSGHSKPATKGRMKTSHFEGSIAYWAAWAALGRNERTQRELAAFNIDFGGQRLVPPADCA